MPFGKLLHTIGRRSPLPPPDGLLGREEIDRILQRERARSDRTGDVFSFAVFTAGKTKSDSQTLCHVARILKTRLRLTDDAGRMDERRIGVVLPITPASGAWTVIDDVCVCIPAGLPLPDCAVFCYPSDSPDDAMLDDREDTSTKEAKWPSHAMETLFARRTPLWKRCVDMLGASLGLMVLSPLLATAAVAVKLSSPGPVFFSQKRSGLGGREFSMLKLRSMAADAEEMKSELMAMNEQDGPAFKIKNDPRITRVGKILRATSIDELPQLWNVLRGEMSLVGPRPLPCDETAACRGWQRRRLDVVPGLTCFWQVEGRSKVSFAEWVRMDVKYIRSRSLKTDLVLILKTIPAVIMRKGAS